MTAPIPRVGDTITTSDQYKAALAWCFERGEPLIVRESARPWILSEDERGDAWAWSWREDSDDEREGEGPGGTVVPAEALRLPVTVLHVPGEQPRPSVTDDALAEAERRYTLNEQYYAFIEGAEWAASRAETTTLDDRLIDAVLVTYTPEGVATWLRQWLHNPDRRARMAHGVLSETPDAGRTDRAESAVRLIRNSEALLDLDEGTVIVDETNEVLHYIDSGEGLFWSDVWGNECYVNLPARVLHVPAREYVDAASDSGCTETTIKDAAQVLDDVIQHLRKVWSPAADYDEARQVIDAAEVLLDQALTLLVPDDNQTNN